jgi:hypothetical protein
VNPWRATGAIVAVLLAGGVVVYAFVQRDDESSGRSREMGGPFELNEDDGSFRGVRIGDTAERIQKIIGAAIPGDTVAPLGVTPGGLSPPPSVGAPDSCRRGIGHGVEHLRYRDVTFVTCEGKLFEMFITHPKAKTALGLGIGDRLDDVTAAYSGMDCVETAYGDFGEELKYCSGRRGPYYLYFGGDPIRSLVLATVPLPSAR